LFGGEEFSQLQNLIKSARSIGSFQLNLGSKSGTQLPPRWPVPQNEIHLIFSKTKILNSWKKAARKINCALWTA